MRLASAGGLLLSIAAIGCLAADGKPVAGDFAFDWLRPRSAVCRPLTEAIIGRFRECRREPGAFGLSDPVLVCRVDAHSEYMVFATNDAKEGPTAFKEKREPRYTGT